MTRPQVSVLVLAVFVAGLCSIVYELLIATTSSYFLGDSIRQFSLTIGLFMASMGLGSFLSRRLGERLLESFVAVELGLGAVGGVCVPLLYAVYAYTDLYLPAMLVLIGVVGTLTGLEVPVLVLATRRFFALKQGLSNVLALDYLGALVATLIFPFALLPLMGTFKSSLVVGAVNIAVALVVLRAFRTSLEPRARSVSKLVAWVILGALVTLLIFASNLLRPWHHAIYEDRVLLVRQSTYQKIVVTQRRNDLRLYLNGNLQFSSLDEYRYHEALVHPAMSLAPRHEQVLVLGGGDGLGVRELLKYLEVKQVTLVDLDPTITRLAREHHLLRELNANSLNSDRVRVYNEDAWVFVEKSTQHWDVIIIDLPDPNNVSLARLYSKEHFSLIRRRLAKDGVLVTQATSPFFSRDAFWCIRDTLQAAGLHTRPYHANVPSFGDWGFILATHYAGLEPASLKIRVPTRYIDDAVVPSLFKFPKDVAPVSGAPSTLDDPRLLQLYLQGWKKWS